MTTQLIRSTCVVVEKNDFINNYTLSRKCLTPSEMRFNPYPTRAQKLYFSFYCSVLNNTIYGENVWSLCVTHFYYTLKVLKKSFNP